ncbi:Hypothetical protein NTJ_05373 [Nesidiocoris tenuis]|uniref:Uncharacterized protein n=1 Tax=Nesidiocoris tenuis TaxID=355587 RepID=A0ABN7AMU6_9HEMI|nr:Hypothetical protein NTJ_05373 [Nesidiocoris tenuis]
MKYVLSFEDARFTMSGSEDSNSTPQEAGERLRCFSAASRSPASRSPPRVVTTLSPLDRHPFPPLSLCPPSLLPPSLLEKVYKRRAFRRR